MYVFFLEFSNLKCQAKLEGLPPSANDLESTDLKLFKFFQAKSMVLADRLHCQCFQRIQRHFPLLGEARSCLKLAPLKPLQKLENGHVGV